MMLALVLALVPAFAAVREDPAPKPTPPDTERVKVALTELKDAFAKSEAGPRIRAIEASATIADAEIVRVIGRGLEDKDVTVQKAAIEALRFNAHPKAVDELLTRAKSKAAKEDLPVYATLLRAVGQHGDPRSIEALTDNPWAAPDAQVIEARILGLGRVRTKESLKALTDLMEIAGPNKIQPFMKDFRVALWSLTGADQAESRDLWLRWYRENKAHVKILPEPMGEPRELARRWQRYWGEDGVDGRGKRSGDRGDDRRKDGDERRKDKDGGG